MMRSDCRLLVWIGLMSLLVSTSAAGDYLYVKDITMRLEEGNATFELNYTLDSFTNLYVLALGCKYIEHDLISLLGNYSQVRVVRAGPQRASLLAVGAGKYNSGYYLFDSRPLGSSSKARQDTVPQFTVVYPGGRARSFYNVTSTQNVFCEAKMLRSASNVSTKSNNTLSYLRP